MRVILVSDTHLSPAAPEAAANWDAVLRYVGANAPDVVIHLGDLTLDGAHNAGDLHYGRRQLDRLPVPWHAIPGNHDIGDNPWPGALGDLKRCGIVSLDLANGTSPEPVLVEPDGIAQLTVGTDIPDPYHS